MEIIGLTQIFKNDCPFGYKVLIEMKPGYRTLIKSSYSIKNGYSYFKKEYCYLNFPWMYYEIDLKFITTAQCFAIYSFKSCFSKEKAIKGNYINEAMYKIIGEPIIFHNTHLASQFANLAMDIHDSGYVPCYGDQFQYPKNKNLYDAIELYMNEFFTIPFTSCPIPTTNLQQDQVVITVNLEYKLHYKLHSNLKEICQNIWK